MSYVLVALVVSLLIGLHELGHFLAARACGIPVARFSVGFGPKVLAFEGRSTSYWLSAIPLGGYVLPAMDEREFEALPVRHRIVYALGGPAANLVAAFCGLLTLYLAAGDRGLGAVVARSGSDLLSLTGQVLGAIPALFSGAETLSGVVGIVAVGGAHLGGTAAGLLTFAVLLNVNLAVLNLLPIPPLDGARVVFCVLERIWPPILRVQRLALLAGWGFLLAVLLYATVGDVARLLARALA